MTRDISDLGYTPSDDEQKATQERINKRLSQMSEGAPPMYVQPHLAQDPKDSDILHSVKEVLHLTDELQVNKRLNAGWIVLVVVRSF